MILKVACLQKLNNDICHVLFFFLLNFEFLFLQASKNVDKEKNEEEGKKI